MNKLLPLLALFSAHVFATPVNVNSADAKTISTSLVGVSIKKAEAIVADRTRNGVFKTVDDLKRVIGIGEKTIAVNRADILLSSIQNIAPNPNTSSHRTKHRHSRTRERHGHTPERAQKK